MTFPPELRGAVWHTTSVQRFADITRTGNILAEPGLPDSERWKTVGGPENYPYVRKLGGVSLFDFREFDEGHYCKTYPLSTWQVFVPFRYEWKSSIWIEIDHEALKDDFISGAELLKRWKAANSYSNTIMPLIESASLVPIPTRGFKRVLKASGSPVAYRNY